MKKKVWIRAGDWEVLYDDDGQPQHQSHHIAYFVLDDMADANRRGELIDLEETWVDDNRKVQDLLEAHGCFPDTLAECREWLTTENGVE